MNLESHTHKEERPSAASFDPETHRTTTKLRSRSPKFPTPTFFFFCAPPTVHHITSWSQDPHPIIHIIGWSKKTENPNEEKQKVKIEIKIQNGKTRGKKAGSL
jgi:hypothetical protein